jgi:hypothetical protein
MLSESMTVTAQENINFTNSDKQIIIVTWLNETKTMSDPVISVSSEDFWKFFAPLLEQSAK